MTTAREIMTPGAECIQSTDTLADAARKMRDLDVGALPICGEDNRLQGILTDRDIVVKCIAEDGDPTSTTAGELAEGKPVTIQADADLDEALAAMSQSDVRRLPVIDEDHQLVGMLSQADLAKHLPDDKVGMLVGNISSAPPNN
ncbi:CBS domain-containing protein [Nocardioides gansuensis]|uniref:CBS domain-containing protein n=1 Tax=Nocardioides gansuensis TaxID=2138300 RepID=A0A2T8F6U2_9ACTN|nr:CBS domain-containing protein [Nocardioides gansuensis]PVG81387.1 CBS domain-containing protein [Nocardioides gansuensis]